jgi:hypothetical protein
MIQDVTAKSKEQNCNHDGGSRWWEHRMRLWTILTLLLLSVGLVTPAVTAQTIQQLRVRWDAYPGAPAAEVAPGSAPVSAMYTVLERQRTSGTLPRQRNPQLSSDQLLVVAVNAQGESVDTQLIPDPRVLRAETPGPTGELSGQILHRANPEFLLTLPDDPAITELRLYYPRWTGTAFVLELLGAIALH